MDNDIYTGKIVFLDAYTLNPGDLDWAELKQFPGLMTYERTLPADVVERIGDARIVITNKTVLTEKEFAQLPNLELICVAATGYDVVDVAAARRYGITVCNCAGYSTGAVAQAVVAHLLEVTNQVGHYTRAVVQGKQWAKSADFCYWDLPLTELDGKKLAVVGFGNIGKAVTDRLRPFGMRLFAVTSKSKVELPVDVEKIGLEEAFACCDVVSLHCPLTVDNQQLVGDRLLEKARKGLVLINTARGGLIDDEAVARALASGRLGAYCCDVLSVEPAPVEHPLLKAERVFITPHIAWAAREARCRIIRILSDNIMAYLKGMPRSVVN